MTSKDYFKINGVSSDTLDIYVDTPPVPPMAQQSYTTYQTGSDENGTTADDVYSDIEITLKFYTFFNSVYNTDDIYAFFADAKTLEISRYPDKYFKVRKVSPIQPVEQFDANRITYTVKLTVAPFKYSTDNDAITVHSGDVITNNGTRYSKLTLTISGSGTVEITVNGKAFGFTFPDGVSSVVISSEYMDVRNATTNKPIYNAYTGEFPLLNTGANQISWSGNISSMELTKNERWY